MAITFPRDLPAGLKFRSVRFDPHYTQVRAPTLGDGQQVANLAPDLWKIEYETAPLALGEASVVEAWLHSLRGGTRLFKAVHPLRRHVAAYRLTGYTGLTRAGGGAFDGNAELVSIGAGLDTLTFDTLPAAFPLAVGDMLSLGYASGVQALHRVVEAGTASGAGEVTVGVEPQVVPGATAGTAIALINPWCKAVVDAKSIGTVYSGTRAIPRASFKFTAMSVYR